MIQRLLEHWRPSALVETMTLFLRRVKEDISKNWETKLAALSCLCDVSAAMVKSQLEAGSIKFKVIIISQQLEFAVTPILIVCMSSQGRCRLLIWTYSRFITPSIEMKWTSTSWSVALEVMLKTYKLEESRIVSKFSKLNKTGKRFTLQPLNTSFLSWPRISES